jgi:hypothetical protein
MASEGVSCEVALVDVVGQFLFELDISFPIINQCLKILRKRKIPYFINVSSLKNAFFLSSLFTLLC